MKKIILLLASVLLALQIMAEQKVWTLKTIPNPHSYSYSIHVSDPDNFLSDETEMYINQALHSIVRKADVVLVAVGSIGNEDTQQFRNELFNSWGIGDKEKNNGLLMLFVEDQHKMEFETGYGLESELPDVECYNIYTKFMKPYFKQNQYEKGLCSGVTEIVKRFDGTVDGKIDVQPLVEMEEAEEFSWFKTIGIAMLFLCCVKWFFDLLYWLMSGKKGRQDIRENSFSLSLIKWPFNKKGNKYTFKDFLNTLWKLPVAIIVFVVFQSIGVLFLAGSTSGDSGSSGGGGGGGGSSGGGGYSGSW